MGVHLKGVDGVLQSMLLWTLLGSPISPQNVEAETARMPGLALDYQVAWPGILHHDA